MKYIAVDIETTGLDESFCQILEIGAVFDDGVSLLEELPSLRMRFYYDRIIGEPIALQMNAKIIGEIPDRKGGGEWTHPDSAASLMRTFIEQSIGVTGKATLAGKNFGTFDSRFLRKLRGWDKLPVHRRCIDVGNLYMDLRKDTMIPDTKECIIRSGINWDASRLHSAIDDCRLVIALIQAAR